MTNRRTGIKRLVLFPYPMIVEKRVKRPIAVINSKLAFWRTGSKEGRCVEVKRCEREVMSFAAITMQGEATLLNTSYNISMQNPNLKKKAQPVIRNNTDFDISVRILTHSKQ
jgi:hypothetical protein